MWNCGRGLLCDGSDGKMPDVKRNIDRYKPHLFCIVEADLHGSKSRLQRQNTYTTQKLEESLSITGYSIILPDSWYKHDQARLVVFVSDDVKTEIVPQLPDNSDLPCITLDVGLGRAKKTRVNYYYREWTSGITGDNSQAGQMERLQRLIHHWTELPGRTLLDTVTLGDSNLCGLSWENPDYPSERKELANRFKQFLLSESFVQLVSVFTRSQTAANGTVSRSCLDFICTNVPDKCDKPVVVSAGDSDHLAVQITKHSKHLRIDPKTIKKRNYKKFQPGAFLAQIYETDFSKVLQCNNPDEAVALFSAIFGSILNRHAPIKTYQTRTNY